MDPAFIFRTDFSNFLAGVTPGSHLADGVVDLTVRAYDVNGGWMTANVITFASGQIATNQNVLYSQPNIMAKSALSMYSNTLPASVQIEMGVLEDRALQRAESLGGSFAAQSNYLANAAGQVHLFRQRVSIPNVDPSAYPMKLPITNYELRYTIRRTAEVIAPIGQDGARRFVALPSIVNRQS